MSQDVQDLRSRVEAIEEHLRRERRSKLIALAVTATLTLVVIAWVLVYDQAARPEVEAARARLEQAERQIEQAKREADEAMRTGLRPRWKAD